MNAPSDLRPPGRPLKVSELLLSTVLTLAGRGPESAKNFLTWLAGPSCRPAPNPEEPTR